MAALVPGRARIGRDSCRNPVGWPSDGPASTPDRRYWPPFGGSGADSGDSRPAFMEDEALEVVSEVGQADQGAGPVEPDGANEQAYLFLLVGEDAGQWDCTGNVATL